MLANLLKNNPFLQKIYLERIKIYTPLILSKYKVLSLGCSCYIKIFMSSIGVNQETHFFDYIGTPMCTVNNLINDDFKNLFEYKDYKNMEVLSNVDDGYNITHKKHYLVIRHDFRQTHKKLTPNITFPEFRSFKDSYTRRIQRWKELLQNDKPILFMRYEQYPNFIKHDIFKDKFEKDELTYLQEFSNLIKTKYPHLKFNIIFFYSNIENSYYDDIHNIFVLKNNQTNYDFKNCHFKLHQICLENIDLLQKNL